MEEKGLTYADTGVDIDAAEVFVAMIKDRVQVAWPELAKEIGGFAGSGIIPKNVNRFGASTDGVGTKLKLAALLDYYLGVGQDVVAMSAVDTYVNGEKPAYFLDYFATGKLDPEKHIEVIESVIAGCKLAGCKLIGGESAEMQGFFKHDWFIDLVSFVIGFPEPSMRKRPIEVGQKVMGWFSHCPASNGFSLINKTFGLLDDDLDVVKGRLCQSYPSLGGQELWQALLAPTPIWINEIEKARAEGTIFARHIHNTGGGLVDNPPRVLPDNFKMAIKKNSWQRPPIFRLIQDKGNVPAHDMDRTFNNGIMVLSIVSDEGQPLVNENAVEIGRIEKRKGNEKKVEFIGEYVD
ncbi:MAG: AIR synthase related protein [Patescibacteria group bacterium]|nr:AIR synthase related protein [Patescibacteria group bacterium]